MNPLIRSPKHLAAYLAAWLPVMAGMILLVNQMVPCTLFDVSFLVVPALSLQMFMFGGVWYVARATPLRTDTVAGFLIRHMLSFAVMTSIWLYTLMIYSEGLNTLTGQTNWRSCFDAALPLFIAMGFFIYFVAALISYLTLTTEQTRHREVSRLESIIKQKETELKFRNMALPNEFMLNALQLLQTYSQKSPAKFQTVLSRLRRLLENSPASRNTMIPLKEELENIRCYLDIEHIRLDNRLHFELRVDPDMEEERLPGFLLIPLAENAVKHGLEPARSAGSIILVVGRNDTHLLIEISNPLPEHRSSHNPNGQGLLTLKNRLQQMYENPARIVVHKGDKAFSVKLYLPRQHASTDRLSTEQQSKK